MSLLVAYRVAGFRSVDFGDWKYFVASRNRPNIETVQIRLFLIKADNRCTDVNDTEIIM
jgi:hypothetical protein